MDYKSYVNCGIGKSIYTLMSPLLILARVPMSNTGVFPAEFFSWRGPIEGRWRPSREVSPRTSHDKISRKRSTRCMGNHFSNHIDSPKVDRPSISLGRTCTFNHSSSSLEKCHQKDQDAPTKGRLPKIVCERECEYQKSGSFEIVQFCSPIYRMIKYCLFYTCPCGIKLIFFSNFVFPADLLLTLIKNYSVRHR